MQMSLRREFAILTIFDKMKNTNVFNKQTKLGTYDLPARVAQSAFIVIFASVALISSIPLAQT